MSNVINLGDARQAREPHAQGPVKCLRCRHEWHAVWQHQFPMPFLECPQCEAVAGVMSGLYEPAAGRQVWSCRCGNELMYVCRDGSISCPLCGTDTEHPHA
ncbi:MAG: hypothetical protein R3E87_07335 [Burkholderiaceae bacterium]